MKKLFLLTIIASPFFAIGQNKNELDSLLNRLETEKDDSIRIRVCNDIGNLYINNNPGKAIMYFEKALQTANIANKVLRQGNAYYDIAYANLLKGDFDKALENYQNSIKLYEELNDKRRTINALMSIGNVYSQTKNLTKATEYYNKAEAIIKITKDSTQLKDLYGEKGLIYDQFNDNDTALFYLTKSLQLSKALNDDFSVGMAYSNIALTYKHNKNYSKAIVYLDSCKYFFDKIEDLPSDILAAFYNNVGAINAKAKNYSTALEAFNQSIRIAKQSNYQSLEMENYNNLAEMYGNTNDYKQQGIYLKKFYNLKDSLFSADSKNKLTELESDYKIEKTNNELSKVEILAAKQKNQRNIFIGLALAALGLAFLVNYFLRKSKTQNLLLQQKNEQINQQKNELQTLNQVKDRLFSIISHDLRNPLITLKSYLSLTDSPNISTEQKEGFKKQTLQAVSQTSGMLDNLLVWATMQIKNTKPTLIPIQIEDCIDDAISAAKLQATQKNIAIEKHIEISTAIADYTILEIALRNIITNAVKYSNTNSKIFVTATKNNTHNLITIKDEGVGMSAEKIEEILKNEIESTYGTVGEKGSGLGLFLTKELIDKINGKLIIKSELNKGTSIAIQLPL